MAMHESYWNLTPKTRMSSICSYSPIQVATAGVPHARGGVQAAMEFLAGNGSAAGEKAAPRDSLASQGAGAI